MKHIDLKKILKKSNLPVAYDHFSDNKNMEPPFIVYREQEPNNFKADNKVYSFFSSYEIELVTSKKDVELENKISTLLTENDIPYDKTPEIWDKDEEIYHIFYEI